MRLGKISLRSYLYSRRMALRVGLIKPSITWVILLLKLHVGYKQPTCKIGMIIQFKEDIKFLQDIYKMHPKTLSQ